MSNFEQAWRAWIRLGEKDRGRFLQRLRAHHAEEMEARRVANGTAAAYRGPSSLAGQSLDGADLEPREMESLSLGEGF